MKKKLLIINHDVGIFGASRSLQLLTNNLDEFEIDMIVPSQLRSFKRMYQYKSFTSIKDEKMIRDNFGQNINRIYNFMLDMDLWCNVISEHISKKKNIYALIEFFVKAYDKRRIKKILLDNNYDYVYCNSTVLHNYVTLKNDETFLIHIREDIVSPNPKRFLLNYQCFDGAIFIDHASFSSVEKVNSTKNKIIMNPFDMTDLNNYEEPSLGIDHRKNKIYSMFGQIKDVKGSKFIIRSFIKADLLDSILLIIGDADPLYLDECKEMSKDYNNIVYLPSTKNIKQYYLITDYLIRGEKYLALGRTIYEALYSGCNIIIPVDNKSQLENYFFEYKKFKSYILDFIPENESSLIAAFKSTHKKNKEDVELLSNVLEHVQGFKNFLQELKY